MKGRRILLVLFLTLITYVIQAQPQEIIISGVAAGFAGEEIGYKHYSDRISYEEEVLASARIGAGGKFELKFTSNRLISGRLVIGFHAADLIVLPGESYEVSVSDSSRNALLSPANSFIRPYTLRLNVHEPASKALNRLSDSLQNEIDRVLLDTNRNVTPAQIKKRYSALVNMLNPALNDSSIPFLQQYALYSLAPVDAMINRLDDTRIWLKYLHNRPILYEHPVYMQFFNEYFSNYPERRIKFIRPVDLETSINRLGSTRALLDSLGKDSLLRNERLREFVAIKTLAGLYTREGFSSEKITSMLREFSFTSKFPEHRTAALNVLRSFKSMRSGESLPAFRLASVSGDSVSGNTYAGYPVYYSFITSWCEDCIAELMVMKKLQEKYKGKIRFVSILCNGDAAVAAGFLRQHPDWKWDFLLLDKNIEMLQRFKIRSFPTFLMAGHAGEVIRFPAPAPSQGLERFLDSLSEKR